MSKQTVLGGFVCLYSTIIMFVCVGTFLMTILLDGIQSNIAYIPTDINMPFLSDYKGQVTFLGYNGPCENQQLNVSSCALDIRWTGVTYYKVECLALNNTCRVDFECIQCSLLGNLAQFSVSSPSVNVYTSGFHWYFSSLDYFNESTRVSGNILSNPGNVFKGYDPTIVNLIVTPTLFQQYSEDLLSGINIKLNSEIQGSQLTNTEFGSEQGLGFIMTQNLFESTIFVKVTDKQTNLSIFAQVLAVISGIFTAGRFTVSFIHGIKKCWRGSVKQAEPTPVVQLALPA